MNARILLWRRAAFAVLFSLLLSVAGLTNATAQTFTVGNLYYSINSGYGTTVTVTGHVDGTNASGELVIPESVTYSNNSYLVTVIGENAFFGCSGLTGDLVIPNSVTRVNNFAFFGCSGLTGSLTLSENLTYIGYWAFASCNFSGNLTIPESVTSIGAIAFSGGEFTSLNFNAINCTSLYGYWYFDGGDFFFSDYNGAFEGLDTITLNFGENVQRIPDYAFRNVPILNEDMILPNSLIWIGSYAFSGCTNFTGSLNISNSVTQIGQYAFENTGFTSLFFNAENLSSLSSSWLYGVTSLTSLSIGESVQRIPDDFVKNRSSFIGSLTFPNSLTYIGANAFLNCSGFTGSLIIPNLVNYIGANAFSSCTGFSDTLTLGSSITEIGNSAFFSACENFTSFDVKPETPPTLGSNVFTSANYDMPIQVPCGSLDAYNNASGWDEFTNIQEINPCMWDITATANPENAGTIGGAGTYEQSLTCTLTATPNEDYVFVNWTEDGEEVSTEASYSFTVTGDRDLVANFRYIRYEIAATANPDEGGTISGIGSYLEGETCTLTATPNEGYNFVNWTENGEEVTTETSYSFTVTGDRDLVANFALATYTITVMPNQNEGGTVAFMYDFGNGTMQGWSSIDADGDGYGWDHYNASSHSGGWGFVYSQSWVNNRILYPDNYLVSPIVSFSAGSFVTFYARAQDASYAAEHFGVAISTTSNTNPNDFTTIQEWTLSAKGRGTLTEVPRGGNRVVGNWYQYTVDLSAYAGQSGYVAIRHFNCSDMYWIDIDDISISSDAFTANFVFGSNCTMLATPNYGYGFENWTENGNVVSNDEVYSFTVTGDRDLVANFVKVPFSITATPNFEDRGTVSGAGEYVIDTTCTLTATPAEGHSFLRWLENGQEVSTDAEYTFIVAGPRDLVAVFSPMEGTYIVFADPNVEAICLNNWDTDSDGFLSYDEAAAVTNLGQVFYYNRNITSFDELQYFTGLTYINEYEFEYCENLTSVILPQNVTSIGYAAFGSCHNLTGEFVIPNSVTYIGANAFYNCNSLTSIIIPDGITSIEEGVFDWCSSLETINIPNSVETIGNWAFNGCTSLTNLVFPSSLTSIGYKAFSDCRSLSGTLEIPMLVTSIEDEAFRNCTSLTGLVLPENLQYIGSRAFQNCSGLRGEITLPETLESVGGYAFYGCDGISTVNYNVVNCQTMGSAGEPVFYDCAFSHLRIGENVESIPDFAFKHCFLINDISSGAVTPPTIYSSTFGMVSRNIPVSVPMGSGEAYRTAPYWEEFFHITEDYSPNSYTYHWNVNIHQFETNMTVTGIIQIEGVEQAVPYLEIGAFCNGECRGRQLLTYYPEVDRYLVFLMLYGETGDMFNFKLYNHETNEESVAGCVSVVTFEPNAIVGTFEEPFVFNFTNMQLTQFYQGWNWWSTYIEQEGIDGLTMLEEGLGSNGFQIKSQTDYVTNYGTMWFGMLSSITNEETYMVNNTADCIVAMPGMPATPSDHPINISNGWNWIGYPCTNTMSVSEAFAGLESTNGDQVKSQADYAMYFNGVWFGQLQNITPGTGLMYMSNNTESTTLVYPDGSRNTEAATSAKATHWTNDIHAYPHNMTVMAVVELNDEELNSENYELAAFANGECRGSVKLTYVEPLNRHVAFLTIAGNDAVELGFRLYDAETGTEYYDAEETLSFTVNATIGEPEDVFVVHFRGTTGMDELSSSVQVYPNPVNGGERFSIGVNAESKTPVRVEIVNAMGVETLRATSTQMPAMLTAPSVAGVYTLRITVEGKGTIIRKLVVR